MAAPNGSSDKDLYLSTSFISDNATTTDSAVVALTSAELWIQLIVFYGLLGGVVSTSCSILIWVGIWRKKELRSRFFIIVACLTVCRTGECLQFLFMCLHRSLRTLGVVETNQLWITCHFIHFVSITRTTLELSLLCTLVVDRMIAVTKINYYRLLSDQSAFYVCLAQYILVSAIKLIPSYVGYDIFRVVPCLNIYSFMSETFNNYAQGVDVALVCLILVLYFVLITYVQCKVKVLQEAAVEKESAKLFLQRQLKLMPVLRNLVFLHCGLTSMSKVLLFASGRVPSKHAQRVTAAGGIATSLDLFVNVVWLLITNKEVRHAALPCRKKKTNVITIQSTALVR